MRREVQLPADDIRALDALGYLWETILEGGMPWLLIHGFAIPEGYNHQTAIAAIRLGAYPAGKLDMIYFHPALARSDGKPINAVSTLTLQGRAFQQWSRHYGWRQGIDTLASHIRKACGWLRHEFRKR